MSETKETILKMGDELIRQKGYNAFSYQDISRPLGIKNAAVHYHFPSKSDLLVSVTQFHIQRFITFKENVQAYDELEQIKRFTNIYIETWQQSRVCFVGAIATDWDTINAEAQPVMKQMAADILNWLTNALKNGLTKGVLQFNEEPQTKALLIVTNMMAATQLARITGAENFEIVRQAVIDSITPKR